MLLHANSTQCLIYFYTYGYIYYNTTKAGLYEVDTFMNECPFLLADKVPDKHDPQILL